MSIPYCLYLQGTTLARMVAFQRAENSLLKESVALLRVARKFVAGFALVEGKAGEGILVRVVVGFGPGKQRPSVISLKTDLHDVQRDVEEDERIWLRYTALGRSDLVLPTPDIAKVLAVVWREGTQDLLDLGRLLQEPVDLRLL